MPSPVEILFEANSSDYGIIVEEVNGDIKRLREKLYAARKEHSPAFDHISIATSPTAPDRELWVVNRLKELDK